MTTPRQLVPGRYYLVTRRCTQRLFLLRPDPRTNAAFLFCLLAAAARSGVHLIAFTNLSNHYHVVVYDPEQRVTEFTEHAHKLMARLLNARWGRWENFWSNEPTCVTHLVTPQDVMRAVLYTLMNPVRAGLVEAVHHWPGVNSLRAMLTGTALVAQRPAYFFRENGPVPQAATLQLLRPPGFETLSQDAWAEHLQHELQQLEENARQKRLQRGARVLGRRQVRHLSPFDKPRTAAPRRTLRPEVACRNPFLRALRLSALRAFRIAHERARQALFAGNRDAVFPFGTVKMRQLGLCCAGPPG